MDVRINVRKNAAQLPVTLNRHDAAAQDSGWGADMTVPSVNRFQYADKVICLFAENNKLRFHINQDGNDAAIWFYHPIFPGWQDK